jgi:TPR repeat protein
LKFKAEDGYPHEQYLYARRFLEDDEPDEAEYWLKQSASKGNRLAMYMLYRCYRDGKIEDREGEKMKYLLMAVDKEYGFAEYEYSKLLSKTKSDMAIEYMRQASRHGCPMAEYAVGKLFLERGNTDLALPYLESAASKNTWARFYLGLLYYYKLDDKENGMEYLRMAEDQNFEPARAAITQIEYGYNARIVAGVFNLFYYASRIIDEDSEDMYPHPAFADVDMRAKKEDRAKRMGLTMGGM